MHALKLPASPARWRCVHALKLSLGVLIACIGVSGCATSLPTVTTEAGVSPFIAFVHLDGFDLSGVTGAQFTIAPKPGSVSRPVHVEYSLSALAARGYFSLGSLTLPVFGLYAGYQNQVSVEVERSSVGPLSLKVTVPTAAYIDPSGIYDQPTIVTPRAAGSALGFDFIFIRSGLGSPVIIDTDGEICWAAPRIQSSFSSAFRGDEFIIGDPGRPTVYGLRLDGNIRQADLPSSTYTDFNHNINRGKFGFLAEVDAETGGVASIESNVIEFQDSSSISILNQWDLGAILGAYMSNQGDDAAAFVRPGVDWLGYSSGAIMWILGDPTKYWYTFPSLRARALTLAPGGLYPIGQHALSITFDGLLMLFNDGLGSLNQPSGEPAGQTRTYSTVSAYSIDQASMTATQVWDYDAGQMIFSPVCSSAYEAADRSILVDYATASGATEALLVGLDSSHNVVFEFKYPTSGCNTSWNARPIPLDDLKVNE